MIETDPTGTLTEPPVIHAYPVGEVTPRVQLLRELREVLDMLEANPDLPLPRDIGVTGWDRLSWYPANAPEAARLVKALGGRWEKNDPKESEFDAQHLWMKAKLGQALYVDVLVSREGICEKKVVGTERKTINRVVQEAVTEKAEIDVEVFEYECKSLMSLADQQVMAELEAVAS